MKNTLLDLCDKVPKDVKQTLLAFHEAVQPLCIDYIIVGATARDFLMVYGFGAKLERATYDIDFAIRVKSWQEFQLVKEALLNWGFSETRILHRLDYHNGGYIDLVPFGQLEFEPNKIAWPPKGDSVMNTIGYSEACEHAIKIVISRRPEIIVPVVSPEGFVLMKLVAWSDRKSNSGSKDLQDILYVLKEYHRNKDITDVFYDRLDLIEKFDGDVYLGAAYILGQSVKEICNPETLEFLMSLLGKEIANITLNWNEEITDKVSKRKFDFFYAFLNGLEFRSYNFKTR